MVKDKILIIGTRPPPIGGVTIHVERLLGILHKRSFPVRFLPMNIKKVFFANFFRDLVWCDVIHLHTSNPYVRLIASMFCRLLGIRLISTIHGSLGRFRGLRNWADLKSVKWTESPLVLNKQSLDIALSINKSSRMISAFLPPTEEKNITDSYCGGNFGTEIEIYAGLVYKCIQSLFRCGGERILKMEDANIWRV